VELREFRAELPSTQTEAVRRAREGAFEGTRVVAGRQTAGRGRNDHRWASPDGNLYVSIVCQAPPERRGILPLAVGACLRSDIESRFRVPTVLKWPNDLLVAGPGGARKLAGILVEVVPSPRLGAAAVVGIGINVSAPLSAYPDELRGKVASLSEFMPSAPPLRDLEQLATGAVERAVRALQTPEGAREIVAECRAALHGVGRTATVDARLTGTIRTVGDEGELWLDTPSGAVAIRSGDVVVEEA
jgi:BirA family transcriptional regulator, biotin operon repressor / biotin---[acetyl-CoA-carboxylase] ligase